MKTPSSLLIVAVMTAASVNAASRWELTGSASVADDEPLSTITVGAGGSFYIDPLQANGPEPLAEAAFIERPRSIQFGIDRNSTEDDDGSFDRDETMVRVGYTHGSAGSPHVASFVYEYGDASAYSVVSIGEPSGPVVVAPEVESTTHRVRLAYRYHLRPRISLGLEASAARSEHDYVTTSFDYDNSRIGLVLRSLHALGGDRWLRLRAAVTHSELEITWHATVGNLRESDTGTDLEVAADVYFTRYTSVGISASHGDIQDQDIISGNVRHFFNDRFSLGVQLGRVLLDHRADPTIYSGVLTVRF